VSIILPAPSLSYVLTALVARAKAKIIYLRIFQSNHVGTHCPSEARIAHHHLMTLWDFLFLSKDVGDSTEKRDLDMS